MIKAQAVCNMLLHEGPGSRECAYMKKKFAAIIGMIIVLMSAAVPAQAAVIDTWQGGQAGPVRAEAAWRNDFRYLGNGWHYLEGSWYYVRGGKATTGWVKDAGKWYFLSEDGRMKTGWIRDDGKWYYLTGSGAMKTGWLKDNGNWYYLNKSGARKTGWLRDNGKWYYLKKNGVMMTGWLKIDGNTYYLMRNGVRKTGWLTLGKKKYYFLKNGALDPDGGRKAGKAAESSSAQKQNAQSTGGSGAKTAAVTENKGSGSASSGKTSSRTAAAKAKKTKGEQVVEYALQFVGNPYVYGGCSLTNGTDCSGFVMLIYQHFGVSLPHYDAAIRQKGKRVASLSEARAGDIVCYYGHVAIYIGDGRIVHASNSRDGIKISERADYRTIADIRRIFD